MVTIKDRLPLVVCLQYIYFLMRCSLLMPLLAVQVTDSDSDKFSDGEYLDDDIEKGNAVMAAVTVVVIFLIFFLCMAIMLTWTLLVLGDHQVMMRRP